MRGTYFPANELRHIFCSGFHASEDEADIAFYTGILGAVVPPYLKAPSLIPSSGGILPDPVPYVFVVGKSYHLPLRFQRSHIASDPGYCR